MGIPDLAPLRLLLATFAGLVSTSQPMIRGMSNIAPLRLLLATFAGWVTRHQAEFIDYLVEENRIPKEQLGNKRIRLTNDQRRRLAVKARRSAAKPSTGSPPS